MGDTDKIIQDNMGLVYQQLHKFHLVNDDEALSFAMEALWHAVETYDAEKSFHFSTYATVCIYNALGGYVRHIKRKRQLEVTSYHNVVGNENDEVEFEYFLGDLTNNPENIMLNKELGEVIRKILYEEYNKLAGCTKDIIGLWIVSEYKIKQGELARATGTSQPTVSRALSVFKYKLKKRLEEYQC